MGRDSTAVLRDACCGPAPAAGDLEALPDDVVDLLVELGAPPRLGAHLRAVHAAAGFLVDELGVAFPDVVIDAEAVRFGAATHDIGKVHHPDELSGPGSRHEADGERLLVEHGFPAERARFARTHAAWDDPSCTIEDLLVALADKVWKAKREEELEQLVVGRLRTGPDEEAWDVYLRLDDLLGAIADGADARLAFQNQYPVA